jgi:hypothetical protein
VALAAIESFLAPHRGSGRLVTLSPYAAISADVDGDRISAITLLDHTAGDTHTVRAPIVLDATEAGDLLPMAGVEYVTGAESQRDTGEPHAPAEAQPSNMQGISYCFALDHLAGEDHTIDRPADYDYWRAYRPPFWPAALLSWTAVNPRTLEPVQHTFRPNPETDPNEIRADQSADPGAADLWLFRRILARRNFATGAFASDITLVNWPQMDYFDGLVFEVPQADAERNLQSAKQLSLSLLYWMQTEAPREDGGVGFPGLRLRADVVGSRDGLAQKPYIRESRRIRAMYTIVEQDLSPEVRSGGAVTYADSVGVGAYRIDLHPSTGGDNYIDVPSCPYEIPLGALLPLRVQNLLPACKNIATTHITNGCYRLHPTEWNIGEVAGLLATYCLQHQLQPRQVREKSEHLSSFQRMLSAEGVEMHWPAVRCY